MISNQKALTLTSANSCKSNRGFHRRLLVIGMISSIWIGITRAYPSSKTVATRSLGRVGQRLYSTKQHNGVKMETKKYPLTMSEEEKYLFDLNGFVVVRNVFSEQEVKAANEAIDRHAEQMIERSEDALRNAVQGSAMYGNGTGRKDLGGVLEWGQQDSAIFKSVLAHPRLVPLFHELLGKGYRMDHLPFVIAQDNGAEGFQLHGGTVDCATGEYNPYLAYTCHNDQLRCALLGCSVVLSDHAAGYGGFCVVPGSHKSNFKMPPGMIDGKNEHCRDAIVQPVTKAGDVVLFSEGTVHGALPWTNPHQQRRICLYRFGPSTHVYGRSYFNHPEEGMVGWPSKIYDDLNDAQRAVLEPPYANRLDRPEIDNAAEGTVFISSRSERKKQHDRDLFGTKYF
jgi:ectoine hydroxylase-related dioxygenase (phytanoyl-CoA dioxygenase family)